MRIEETTTRTVKLSVSDILTLLWEKYPELKVGSTFTDIRAVTGGGDFDTTSELVLEFHVVPPPAVEPPLYAHLLAPRGEPPKGR